MSIQTELARLTNAKAAIKAAIEGKGVTVPGGTLLDGMAALIEGIEAGGGGESYDWLDVYTQGSFTFTEDTSAAYSVGTGTGFRIDTKIIEAVQAAGKTATGCFACMWDGTKETSISTVAANSFMGMFCLLNTSSPIYINSGFTDQSATIVKSSSGITVQAKTECICYSGNLITELAGQSGYYRAGRTYNWLCIAFTA